MNWIQDWDGNPISKPGAFRGVPPEIYHGPDLCVGPSISSSGLRAIETRSPRHYWDTSPYNPERREREQKTSLNLGLAAHTLLLGESGFRERFAVRPEQWSDWRTKAAQEWRDAMIEAGRFVITPDDVETIKGIRDSLAANPLVQDGLLEGEVEISIVWQDEETGVWLKARPDVMPTDTMLVDLKTCASADPESVRRSIAEYGYHMQLALAGDGIKAVTGLEPGNDDHVLAFVETKSPFAENIKPVAAESIHWGKRQIRRAVRTFAECMKTGIWRGYDDDGVTAYLPQFYTKRLEKEAEMGLLPEEAA